jgi:hypothetical protein
LATPENPLYRLVLDPPHNFAVEPGYVRSVHCGDLRGKGDATYTEPLTGLIRLKPSFLEGNWLNQCEPLSSFTKQEKYWEEIKRARETVTQSAPGLLATTSEHADGYLTVLGQPTGRVSLTLQNLAIATIISDVAGDQLVWALESKFNLFPDEGFVINVRAVTDELRRYKNWFAVQWDNIKISVSLDGNVRVYEYNRANTSAAPKLKEIFKIGSPGDFANRDGQFAFMPIPGFGLAMYYSTFGGDNVQYLTSANAGTPVGKRLIKWSGKWDATTKKFVHFRSSKWRLAINPMFHHVYGLHRIRYTSKRNEYAPPGNGKYLWDIFDPGFKPSSAPVSVLGLTMPDGHGLSLGSGIAYNPSDHDGVVSAVVVNTDNTNTFTPGVDRQGRIELTLATFNPVYSPQVLGTHVAFAPLFNVRNTIPVIIDGCKGNGFDVLHSLTFSEDDCGRFEGQASVRISSGLGQRICGRGDATFQVEQSLNEGVDWEVVWGGIAALSGQVQVKFDSGGIYFLASWTLKDKWERFKEVPQTLDTAFDRMNLVQAINTVLAAAGEPQLSNAPPALEAIVIPPVPAGQNWRFGTRAGDTGDTIIKNFLMFARKQGEEWRLKYDWFNQSWYLDQKPKDPTAGASWVFTQFEDDLAAPRWAEILGNGEPGHILDFDASPPEANYLQPVGLTSSEPDKATRVPGASLKNLASLTDQNHPDYLGRTKLAQVLFAPLSDLPEINRMGRRAYDVACHRLLAPMITSRWYKFLIPGTHIAGVRTLDNQGNKHYLMSDLWLKRKIVKVNYLDKGTIVEVDYQLSTQWESPLEG